jgi:ABC-type transport system substrate-binding protein
MSSQNSPLRDIRVRKALNYAVNKKELMRYAFKGNGVEMRGLLTEKSDVDLSGTEPYHWNVPKARELLKKAGYEQGFKMKLYYQPKNFVIAQFLQRFYSLVNIEVEIFPAEWETIVKHVSYPNSRDGYSWEDEEWWMAVFSQPALLPELMGGWLEWGLHSGAAWQNVPDSMIEPLDRMYRKVQRTKDREERLQIYKKANEYFADQAFMVFTMTPFSLYGVNVDVDFMPQVSQYLYLDYSSVSDSHWSVR